MPMRRPPSARNSQSRNELSTFGGNSRAGGRSRSRSATELPVAKEGAECSIDMAMNGPYAMTETMRSSASLVTDGP